MQRRDFIARAGVAGIGFALTSGGLKKVHAAAARAGLSNPTDQPKFVNPVPDALSPAFIYKPYAPNKYAVDVGPTVQNTGLMFNGAPVSTHLWGYGDHTDKVYTWPGRTFQIKSQDAGGDATTQVTWGNKLTGISKHLLPVDTSIHWAYSLDGYTQYTFANAGIPMIPHVHGGHTDFQFDGSAEYFFTPDQKIQGPGWKMAPGGFTNNFRYDNDVPAGNIWYHDHALGITHLNVYAGMAGFYFIRDKKDTGDAKNLLGLPAWPYEKAYAIQDRMFLATGELFLPAFPGDPAYDDFIDTNPDINQLFHDTFPSGGPTILTEFFGDHMVVNGLIWPKENVEPTLYRMRLLNGCDSRTLAVRFMIASSTKVTDLNGATGPLPFQVIGADQGFASKPTKTQTLLIEPGARYDILFNFQDYRGKRIIMQNIGGDSPFQGLLDPINWPQVYPEMDRIMAFDVASKSTTAAAALAGAVGMEVADLLLSTIGAYIPSWIQPTRTRKVALFEGRDNLGRIWPHQGTAEPARDMNGKPINYPNTSMFKKMGLIGQINGSCPWHYPTTENPSLNSTERWEIWNTTMDAHPIHLHLVHFNVVERRQITWDSATNEDHVLFDDSIPPKPVPPKGDGAYLKPKIVVMHNGSKAKGYEIARTDLGDRGDALTLPPADPNIYIEKAPRDEVITRPSEITVIKSTFDKYGDYLWHCHILSHEEHEMMRRLWVGPMPGMIMKPVAQAAPTAFALGQNFPNPFNPTTTINFHIPSDEIVELKIFNSLGQVVRTLVNEKTTAGVHNVVWNGKDNLGRTVSAGVYVYQIKAGSFTATKRMMMLK